MSKRRRRKNKARSRAQQRLFGLALAVKRRKAAARKVSAAVRRLAKLRVRIIRKFAQTKLSRLPARLKVRRPATRKARVRRRTAKARRIVRRGRKRKKRNTPLSVPEQHQLAVARRTLRMHPAILGVMGGMTKAQAAEVVKRLGGKKNPLTRAEAARLLKKARLSARMATSEFHRARKPRATESQRSSADARHYESLGRSQAFLEALTSIESPQKGRHYWPVFTRGRSGTGRGAYRVTRMAKKNPLTRDPLYGILHEADVAAHRYALAAKLRSHRARRGKRKNPILQIVGVPFAGGLATGMGFGLGAALTRRNGKKRKGNPLTRAESGRLIWWSRWLRTAVREMRKHGVIEPEAAAFQRGEAAEAARIARFYGKAGSKRTGVKKTRRAIRKSVRELSKAKNPLSYYDACRAKAAADAPAYDALYARIMRDRARAAMKVSVKRKNPLLQQRNEAVRRYNLPVANPPRIAQRILADHDITLSQARKAPGFAKALKGYRKFHGAAPAKATVVRIADGSSKLTRRTVFVLGQSPEIAYRTLPGQKSNKAPKDGRSLTWVHTAGEAGGRKPLLIHDPSSGVTSYLGGTLRVSDWLRH